MRSVRVLGLALAAGLLASQAHAGVPAGASFTSACAGLGFGGGGNAGDDVALLTNNPGGATCTNSTSVVGGFASSSASASGLNNGVGYTNASSSAAGPKAVHLTATNNSAPGADFPAGMANGGFTDQFTQTTGTGTGVWIIPINISGTLDATGLGADATLDVAAYLNGIPLTANQGPPDAALVALSQFTALNASLDRGSLSGSSTDEESIEWRAADYGPNTTLTVQHLAVNQTAFFAVPFTFGVSFDLGFFANVRAGEISAGGDASQPSNSTNIAFQNTISWGGPGYIITDGGSGPNITDFSFDSLTGTDYSTPFSEGVPEPAEWALLLVGFMGLGTARRIRRSNAAARA